MPYPRQYSWEKRIEIFLEFRLKQRVYPVAKKHNVARSTVSGIVKEFLKYGFSKKPRLDLSSQLLSQMQEAHLQRLLSSLEEMESLVVKRPQDNMLGGLELEGALAEGLLPSGQGPLAKRESLNWHLKSTEEAALVEEVGQVMVDYDRRCLALWQDIRRALEEASSLRIRLGDQGGPALYPTMVDMLYRTAFDLRTSGGKPDVSITWSSLGEGPSALSAVVRHGSEEPPTLDERVQVAFGDDSSRDLIQRVVDDYIEANLPRLSRDAGELRAMYRDLILASEALGQAIRKVPPWKVREAICPECPYPEVLVQGTKETRYALG